MLLVARGLFGSRAQARAAVLAGGSRSAGRWSTSRAPRSTRAPTSPRHRVDATSRAAGDKLDTAIGRLGVDVPERTCLGVWALPPGGFVDRLLQGGAARVIAVDVGYGQLDWGLREDPRVTVLERTNARQLTRERLPFEPSFVTADLLHLPDGRAGPGD